MEPLKTALFRTTTIKCTTPDNSVEAFSMQFSISRHATIVSKRNKFALLSTPGAMLFNSPSVHFFSYRKQHCNGGGNCLLICDCKHFCQGKCKNRYLCNVSQQVLSEVVGLRLLYRSSFALLMEVTFISWISTIHI